MPDFLLTGAEARRLAAYLVGEDDVPDPEVQGNGERGQELMRRYGCLHCHAPEDAAAESLGDTFPPLAAISGVQGGCLAPEPDRVPDFGFDDEQRAALDSFLSSGLESLTRRSAAEYVERHLASCTQCHSVNGSQPAWSEVLKELPPPDPMMGGGLQQPPILTWAGGKLRPAWLRGFMIGEDRESSRPWLDLRMPVFHRAELLAQGLVELHGYNMTVPPEPDLDAVMASHGQRLVGIAGGFSCVTCHGIGDQEPLQVFETEGINFMYIHERMRREYFMRWMANPPRIDADSRMPKYSDDSDKTALTETLSGDANKQFEAIWEYLRAGRNIR